jgi:hypothetical protein
MRAQLSNFVESATDRFGFIQLSNGLRYHKAGTGTATFRIRTSQRLTLSASAKTIWKS